MNDFSVFVNRYWIMLSARGVGKGGSEFGKSVALRGSVESGVLTKFGNPKFCGLWGSKVSFLEFRL